MRGGFQRIRGFYADAMVCSSVKSASVPWERDGRAKRSYALRTEASTSSFTVDVANNSAPCTVKSVIFHNKVPFVPIRKF
ncbi:hypothetical protein JOB18_024423 [Solea senegalensis]|uniref:Uncharacterized protein n=1 Tax=Solea senegalensis TaxID=28829 RepID=A0AAV6QMF1_SOLSE|nr:hypothetical protein JOB18_024423 [Solea senegalensis]